MALNAACAVEMVHAFSLIHDDLPAIDNDALRRGRPTCHVVFGEAIAILAGDALFALALQTLAAMETSAEVRAESVLVLTKASGSDGLVGGEVVDVESEGAMIDPETLQYIHARKTGALISAACEIGALVGGASEKERATLRSFGTSIGLAFQIVDDILNETSTTDQLGKSVGSDRDRGKATYPALYGIDGARQFAKEAIEAGLGHLDQLSGPTEFLRSLSAFTLSRVH
jgi:geranylgeranyl diphosphate synthase type II